MQRPHEPPRGLALLLKHHRRTDDEARPLAQALAKRLSHDLSTRLGLRVSFGAENAIGDVDELELGPGLAARYVIGASVATLRIPQAAIYDIVEAMFGGDGSNEPWREPRGPTTLERAICVGVAQSLTEPLSEAFGVTGLTFEGLDDDAAAGRDSGVEIALRMKILGRESRVILRAPAAWRGDPNAGEPRRDVAKRSISECLGDVEIPMRVLLRDRSRFVVDVADLHEGQVLALSATSRTPTLLEAAGVGLFQCRLGQSEGRYTVQIDRAMGADA